MTQLLFPFIVCLLLAMMPITSYGQQCTGPFTKDGILSSLRDRDIRRGDLEYFVKQMQTCGVNFPLSPADEQEFRRSGSYLGKKGLDDLIAAIKNNYRPVIPGPPAGETETHGVLIPANDPTPPNQCEKTFGVLPPDAVAVLLGNAVALSNRFPMVVLRIHRIDMLTLKKTPVGLAVSAKVFDDAGDIIADLEDNEFHVNRNNYFKVKRPDRSTLIVYDQRGDAVLNVRYLNPKAIRVLGIFRAPEHRPLIVEEKKITPHFGDASMCIAGAVVAFTID